MRYAIAGTAVGIIAAGSLIAACSSAPAANPAACKSAMASAYSAALSNPSARPAAEPTSCHGVPTTTVDKYAAQIMGGNA